MFWWEITFSCILLMGDSWLYYHMTRPQPFKRLFVFGAIYGFAAVVLGLILSPGNFGFLRLAAHGVFLHLPALLLVLAVIHNEKRVKAGSLCCALIIAAIGIDAFFIEPYSVELNRYELKFDKLKKPMRIVVLADIQTDKVGTYEAKVIDMALAEKPDMIIMPGDLIQLAWGEERTKVLGELNALLKEKGFSAPLGVFAVGGDVDYCDWPSAFDDLPVTCFDALYTANYGDFAITGMHLWDSYDPELSLPNKEGTAFHIVFGHVPNFALSQKVDADLLIAGHTHGGQVQLPFIGPLLTLCDVPRSWAQGVTQLVNDRILVVSRGIGMERKNAPRLRFLCRPEIVVLDLVINS